MASRIAGRQQIVQNENFGFHHKKASFDENIKSSKTATKKGGAGLGNRKALNDITNKTSVHHEVSKCKMNLPKEEFDMAQERFLHDHRKCIEEQQAARNTFLLDLVLPGHDLASRAGKSEANEAKTDPDIPNCHLELEEMPMSEFSDWLDSSTSWNSPPCSPTCLDLTPFPLAWQCEPVEFELKEENDLQI